MITTDSERQAPTKIEEAEATHLIRYKFALEKISNKDRVLDAPCGSGYGSALLASKAHFVYGLDIHDGAVQHAQEFFKKNNTYYHTSDIQDMSNILDPAHCLDAIISFEGIEHLREPEAFLKEAKRLLKSNGLLIISTPRKPHGSPHHITEYSLEEYASLLSNEFTIQKMYGQIYTDIFDMAERAVNPHDYKKFNFIAVCTPNN